MHAWSSKTVNTAITGLVALCVGLCAAGCSNHPLTSFERLVEARRLSAAMLVEFTKAADAGNRAVMADTDEASMAFAREARSAADAVEKDRAALGTVLQDLDYAEESRLLGEFATRLASYRTLEGSILELAVENSNLKAQRLSFGPVRTAAREFRDALHSAMDSGGGADAWRTRALAAEALADVREIEVLQAPHIAEPDAEAMTTLEAQSDAAATAARRSLDELAGLVRPAAKSKLADARAAFDRIVALNAEIVALSRRNSNVRSLSLALGQKRTATAACEESLRALQDALSKRGFTGTK